MFKPCAGCQKRQAMFRDGAHALLRGDIKRTVQNGTGVIRSLGADVGKATRVADLLNRSKMRPGSKRP